MEWKGLGDYKLGWWIFGRRKHIYKHVFVHKTTHLWSWYCTSCLKCPKLRFPCSIVSNQVGATEDVKECFLLQQHYKEKKIEVSLSLPLDQRELRAKQPTLPNYPNQYSPSLPPSSPPSFLSLSLSLPERTEGKATYLAKLPQSVPGLCQWICTKFHIRIMVATQETRQCKQKEVQCKKVCCLVTENTRIRVPWATPGTRTSQPVDPSTSRIAFWSTVHSLDTWKTMLDIYKKLGSE